MFIFLFTNKLKILLRNKSLIFWTFIFPFVLGTFFYLALSNIGESFNLESIKVAVVNNSYYQEDKNLNSVIESISAGEDKIFTTEYTSTEKDAQNLLNSGKIKGYITVNEEGEASVIVAENGIEETIIKYVLDEYYQLNSTINNSINYYDKTTIYNDTLQTLSENKDYIINSTTEKIDFSINYFFTLIAMTCMYGSLIGLEIVKDSEANLSKKGARISISPVNKIKNILAGLLAAFVIEFIIIILLLLYLIYIFKIDLANHIDKLLLLIIISSVTGILLGMFVGSSNKKSEEFKIGLLISVIMLLSFMSGMMGTIDIKLFFDEKLPIISKINPVNIITDGLYYLFAYNSYNAYYNCLMRLGVISLILFIFTFIFVRRKKYDSI